MENTKKSKFNLVDALVLLVVVLGVAFLGYRFITGREVPTVKGTETFLITFRCNETPRFAADRIQVGDPVTDDYCQVDLGEVVSVEQGEAIVYNVDETGQTVISGKEGYVSVTVVSRVTAEDNGNGLTINANKFGVGHSMVIRPGDSKLYAVIQDIQKVENQ